MQQTDDKDARLKSLGYRQKDLPEELNEDAFNLLVALYKARMFEVCFLNDQANLADKEASSLISTAPLPQLSAAENGTW